MKKVYNILILLLLIFVPFNVYASSIKSEIIIDNKDLTKGDILNVTIKADQTSNEVFNIFNTVIEFDENTFEDIDESSFKTYNGWQDVIYNSETHALIVINRYGTTLNEDIISFKISVSDTANPSVATIGLKDTYVSNPDGDIKVDYVNDDVNINMNVSDLGNSSTTTKYMGASVTNTPVKLYYILTLIVLELVLAIVLVMLYYAASNKLKSKLQKRCLLVLLCIIEAISLSAVFSYNLRRGDVNSDSKIDYNDVTDLANHLVNLRMLSNFKLESADINSDGTLSPADLATLVQRTAENIVYEAKLSDAIMEANAYEKSSLIDIRFLADVTDDETIKYVLIDGEKYKVERLSEDSNEYTIKMETSNESKRYSYNVTEVILENGRSAKVDYETDIVVLKDAPVLSAFTTKEDLQGSQVRIALTLDDNDDAIVNAYYELYKTNGTKVTTGELIDGKNAFNLKLENAVSYKLKLHVYYNRGLDSGEYYGVITDEYDLKIITDYKLQMSNLNLVQNGSETMYIEKGGEIYLTFVSSNISGYHPKKINISGKEYSVTNLGQGKYRVNLPNSLFDGSDLKLSKVILSNGKVIIQNKNIAYKVLKDRPSIDSITKEENIVDSKMNIAFALNDQDKTVNRVLVKLFDKDNVLISEKEITDGNYNVALPTRDTSQYIVRIYADYTRYPGVEEYTYKEELLYEENIKAQIKAYVKDIKIDDVYPDKNSVVKFTYIIDSNYEESVKEIIIDNIIYSTKKVGIDTYEIEVDVGEYAGIKEYTTRKIVFTNDMTYDVEIVSKLDVLKDYPTIENYEVKEDLESSKITVGFDIYDRDSAFTSGKVVLKDKLNGTIVDEKIVILGKNEVEFTLKNAIKYDIEVLINANLDTKTLEPNSENKLVDYVLLSREYMLVTDYKLEITKIDTLKDGVVTDYFQVGETINMTFTSTNLTEYYPIKAKIDGITYALENENGNYKLKIDGKNTKGVKTLKFESIILSNHTEVLIDCSKKIEILKKAPTVEAIDIDNTNTETVNVNLSILDVDNVLVGKKVLVTDEEENVVFENELTTDTFTFNKNESKSYTIEVIGSYDLDTNTLDNQSNLYTNHSLITKTIDFNKDALSIDQISTVHLYKIEENIETVLLSVNIEELNSLDGYVVKVVFKNGEIKTYRIVRYNTENDILSFILESDEWISYEINKYSNILKVDYGSISDGVARKKDNSKTHQLY